MQKYLTSSYLEASSAPTHFPFRILPNLRASQMKNRASSFLKQVFSFITTIVKARTIALKNKTSGMKARLLLLGLLRNKKVLMSAISHKIHALIAQDKSEEGNTHTTDNHKRDNIDATPTAAPADIIHFTVEDECDEYPDLRHSLFEMDDEDDDELGDGTGSVIDLVKNSKEDGEEFCLEDEIDHVADVFIRRFHKQMKMQKLDSFKRYQEMLERSV